MWTESLLHERQENEARLNVMSVERRIGGKPCVLKPKGAWRTQWWYAWASVMVSPGLIASLTALVREWYRDRKSVV